MALAGGVGVNRRGYEDQVVWCVLGTISAEQASTLQTQRLQCPATMRTRDDVRCAVVLRWIMRSRQLFGVSRCC